MRQGGSASIVLGLDAIQRIISERVMAAGIERFQQVADSIVGKGEGSDRGSCGPPRLADAAIELVIVECRQPVVQVGCAEQIADRVISARRVVQTLKTREFGP